MKNNPEIELIISGKKITVNRPEPISADTDAAVYNCKMEVRVAVDALMHGQYVLVVDYFSTGLIILKELKRILETIHSDKSFSGQRGFRSKFREASNKIVLRIKNHKIAVKKSPGIGWLTILYPELEEFLLPFPQVQGLNSAWQWYEKGIAIPVLDNKIFPFFGTYFPTRFEHLRIFEHWLKQLKGDKKSAFDIGTGCGVLAFLMAKYGFEKVYGTDLNPNAIYGVHEYINRNRLNSRIELIQGDLFADCPEKTELMVFNPPWIPAAHDTEGLDCAIYYDSELFPRFFAEAVNRLEPGGRVVLLFSNLARITNFTSAHPIEDELAAGGRFRKEVFVQKKVAAASTKTRRNQNWRAAEMVELWVLKAIV
jgi:SAM-dependent methyltransferase